MQADSVIAPLNALLLQYGLVEAWNCGNGFLGQDYWKRGPNYILTREIDDEEKWDAAVEGSKVWVENRKFNLHGPKLVDLVSRLVTSSDHIGTFAGHSTMYGLPAVVIKINPNLLKVHDVSG